MRKTRVVSDMERFMAHVQKTDGCWLWLGGRDKDGYGRVGFNRTRGALAHRTAYELFKGPFAQELFVCHTCVNPEHLWLGTTTDNQRDSRAKGRNPTWTRTACKKGHVYVDGSFSWRTMRGYRYRHCLICMREYNAPYQREWRKKQKEKAADNA